MARWTIQPALCLRGDAPALPPTLNETGWELWEKFYHYRDLDLRTDLPFHAPGHLSWKPAKRFKAALSTFRRPLLPRAQHSPSA